MNKMLFTASVVAALLVGCSAEDRAPNVVASPDPGAQQAATTTPEPEVAAESVVVDVPAWLTQAKDNENLSCYLDVVEGRAPASETGEVVAGKVVRALGWSVDKQSGVAQQAQAYVRLFSIDASGKEYYFKATRSGRPDVSASQEFARLAPVDAGLNSTFLVSGVAPGRYNLGYVVGDAAHASRCSLAPNHVLVIE